MINEITIGIAILCVSIVALVVYLKFRAWNNRRNAELQRATAGRPPETGATPPNYDG